MSELLTFGFTKATIEKIKDKYLSWVEDVDLLSFPSKSDNRILKCPYKIIKPDLNDYFNINGEKIGFHLVVKNIRKSKGSNKILG